MAVQGRDYATSFGAGQTSAFTIMTWFAQWAAFEGAGRDTFADSAGAASPSKTERQFAHLVAKRSGTAV
jgi:hypothetical protein